MAQRPPTLAPGGKMLHIEPRARALRRANPIRKAPFERSYRPMSGYVSKAVADIVLGLRAWRIWVMLASTDIRKRYRRSRIGQFWITASMGMLVLGLGLLYSNIFGMAISEYLPYVAINIVLWGLVSGLVNDGCTAFVDAEAYMKNLGLPKCSFVLRSAFRNMLVTGHNVLIIVAVMLYFAMPVSLTSLLFIPAMIVIVLNGVWMGLLLGTMSARFRDIPQTVASIMQVVFFLTPVMFHPRQLSANAQGVLDYNPFAALLAIAREPLFGNVPRTHDIVFACGMLVIGWLIVIPFFGKFRDRVVYWL